MTPVYGTDAPQPLIDAMHLAQARWPEVVFGISCDAGEWRLLASCGDKCEEKRLRECVVNNSQLARVLDHSFEELMFAVT